MKPLRTPALAGLALGALSLAAAAQSLDEPAVLPPEDCVVAPGDMPGDTPAETDAETLSDALDPCNGVLEPAPVGDGEMTVLPPEGGETPVITPEDLPPQPPQGE